MIITLLKSFLSCLKIESSGADINNISNMSSRVKQHILIDGFKPPLDFRNVLPYLRSCKPTEADLGSLLYFIIKSRVEWDPSLYYSTFMTLKSFMTKKGANEHKSFISYGFITVATHMPLPKEKIFNTVECLHFDDLIEYLLYDVSPDFFCDI
jgi:hypothetical protein